MVNTKDDKGALEELTEDFKAPACMLQPSSGCIIEGMSMS